MTRHWRRAGKNVDGRPGLAWDVALYVPLMVLMLVKNLHARDMGVYVAENVVARVFIGRQDDPQPQIRDHSNLARAYTALGKDGVEEINALLLHVARDCGFADVRILSSDTTAQELPIGYPNEPGILRGVAQRCGRALSQLKTRGVWGVDEALVQVQTILRSVKEHHLFAKGKQAKRQVLTRLLTEVGQLVVHTRPMVTRLEQSRDRVTQRATATLRTIQRPRGMARCRGRPRDGQKRARQDRLDFSDRLLEVHDQTVYQVNPCSVIAFQRLIRRLCATCHCFSRIV